MYALIRGKQIRYDVIGSGAPILLAHGWGGSSESLLPLGKLLSNQNKVILVDLPGFGKSEIPEPSWGVEEYSEVLADLLKALKIYKVHYFGHSFGGSLGMYLAACKPNLIQTLTLCDSAYKRSSKRSVLARVLHHLFPKKNPQLRIFLYKIFFRSSDLAKFPLLEQNFRKILKYDLIDLPKKISCKTLIIWGERDTITPVSWAHELHQNIKDSALKIIPNTRHSLPLRNPEIVADEVLKFIYS